MSIIARKFPILSRPLPGWLIITLTLSSLLLVFVFQESTELPKLIAWYSGIGIAALIVFWKRSSIVLNIPKPALIAFGIWTALLVIGTIVSSHVVNSVFGIFPRYLSLMFLLSWTVGILLFCTVSKADYIRLLKFYTYIAVLISAFGIAQSFGIAYYGGLNAPIRTLAPSFLGNPNFSAMFVVVAMPILLWMVQTEKKWSFYWHCFCLGVCAIGVVIFNSRGAFLAVGTSFFLYLILSLWKKSWKMSAAILILTLVLSATAALFYYQTRVDVPADLSSNQQETVQTRLLLWDFTTGQIIKKPIFGTGIGNFYIAYRSNQNSYFSNTEWFDDAHNIILELAVTSGIPATIVFLGILGYAILLMFRRYKNSNEVGIEVAIIGGIIAWLASGSFTPVALPIWIFLGLLLAGAWQLSEQETIFKENPMYKVAPGLIGVSFLILGLLMLSSELFLWRARVDLDLQKYIEANKLSKIAVTLFPPNTNADIAYLQTQILLRRYDDIDLKLQQFLNRHPLSSGFYQIGAAYYTQLFLETKDEKYRTRAFDEIDHMISLNRNYFFTYQLATNLSFELGDLDKSLNFVKKGLLLNGKNYTQWMMYARIEYLKNNRTQTINAMEYAYNLKQDPKVKHTLAFLKKGIELKNIPFPGIN